MKTEFLKPDEIEKRSFEIIESELKKDIPQDVKPIVMRVIHTTADFDYAENLCFSEKAVEKVLGILKSGAVIVTDTNMALSGINKTALNKIGCEAVCYMSDKDVAETAKANGTTRASVSVDKAMKNNKPVIYAVGNAPTALMRICEHIEKGDFVPAFVIGVPVGFVNVEHSKEMIMQTGIPYIVARGRKGGSTVAVAILNALLYMITR